MTTDLLFAQSIPHNPSTGIQHIRGEASGMDPSCRIQAPPEPSEGDDDDFLTALKQVFQIRTSPKQLQDADSAQSSISSASMAGDRIDEISDYARLQVEMPARNKHDTKPDQLTSDINFTAHAEMLEGIGFYDALRLADHKNLPIANPADERQLRSIKTLIDRFQQTAHISTADLKTGLAYLSQSSATVFENKILGPLHRNSGQNDSLNQMTDPARFNRWLNGLSAGLPDQIDQSGLSTGRGSAVTRPALTTAIAVGFGVNRSGASFDSHSKISASAELPSAKNDAFLAQSENRGAMIPAKLVPDPPAPVAKTHQNTQTTDAAEPAKADSVGIKKESVYTFDPKITNRLEAPVRPSPAPHQDQLSSPANRRIRRAVEPMTSSGKNPAVVNVSGRQIQRATGEEPLSRIFQDTQLVKKGFAKVQSAIPAHTGSKVINAEAGSNDSGLMNSAGQSTEKSADSASSLKETVTGPSNLRMPTLDQIVRRAVLQLRNGQHEARIDLKPEFFGHIRMQVISDNQQVTVKILAEYGFVKDMIESSSHQLKTDLQQHGLEFDKIEVSVSRDPDDSGRSKENFAEAKAKAGAADRNNDPLPAEEKSKDQKQPAQSARNATIVDFFA